MVGIPSDVDRYQHSEGMELRIKVAAEISYTVYDMFCGGALEDA